MITGLYRAVDRVFLTSFFARYTNAAFGYHSAIPNTASGSNVFIHVPRTGGTSLNNYFDSLAKQKSDHELLYIEPHFIPDFSRPIAEFSYFTILRNPLERAKSYYKLQLKDRSQPYHHLAIRGPKIFFAKCWEVNDFYVRYFSNNVDKKNLDSKDLEKAVDTLNLFARVFDFDDLAQQIELAFPCEGIRFPHLNKTDKEDLVAGFSLEASRQNELDQELFLRLRRT